MIKQSPQYTFKYNQNLGRHGWLRLTPAYSVELVHNLLTESNIKQNILDPFSGTATTPLVAAEKGYNAVSYEINPFLIWLGNAKCKNYSKDEVNILAHKMQLILACIDNDTTNYWKPPIFNIERWWHTDTLQILSKLRYLIVSHFGEPSVNNSGNLIWVAFCRLIIETSSAAFNHVSMSFTDATTHFDVDRIALLFEGIFKHIAKSVTTEIKGTAKVVEMDARYPELTNILFDKVITSPPYPNRMSYIRELRPYMYWTKFLTNANEAGELDWKAIGGTWGIATSRLKSWECQNKQLPDRLIETCALISAADNPNADLMGLYVFKFFDDMQLHLDNLRSVLNSGATLDYIIGNAAFYGIFVDSDKLLQEMMQHSGYSDVSIQPLRKRNSKKGLIEFCISAKWQ
jgi:hypothetical protein